MQALDTPSQSGTALSPVLSVASSQSAEQPSVSGHLISFTEPGGVPGSLMRPVKFTWQFCQKGEVPFGAIEGGVDKNGKTLYIARGWYDGGLHVGKMCTSFGGLLIGYHGKEIKLSDYYVLCGDARMLRWMYISRTVRKNTLQIGKAGPHVENGASYTYNGKEVPAEKYNVLAYL
ncbi:hypothetical protein THASP1DRAFT_28607 [Thamnocephalis sphaerospora]|uniref:Uncharacterized protein n=1 Tax=Thamnocephalis sphaerospora TaxID=78915 RepID=A0A4P9XW14_9FUNG|nr:hypothetical protein THASP1DRAFT_28607 [Thamnocephalis sphaerospora]|eukprot:RKP09600.1 hypothetical protein THASP1DRAFT_28607 [Thamnocephalis sphaerospora]